MKNSEKGGKNGHFLGFQISALNSRFFTFLGAKMEILGPFFSDLVDLLKNRSFWTPSGVNLKPNSFESPKIHEKRHFGAFFRFYVTPKRFFSRYVLRNYLEKRKNLHFCAIFPALNSSFLGGTDLKPVFAAEIQREIRF